MAIERLAADERDAEPPCICHGLLAKSDLDPGTPTEHCYGKGIDPDDAWLSLLGEAVERYAGDCREDGQIVHAARSELDGPAVDPNDLVLFAPEQYARLPYTPYHDAFPIDWGRATSLCSGSVIYVPAFSLFLRYRARPDTPQLAPGSSTGVATGPTFEDALRSALLEVIERDAFALTWLLRLPSERHAWQTHPDDAVRRIAAHYHRSGVEIRLNRLLTDAPAHVFMAIALDRSDIPALSVGLGADGSRQGAARKALLEAVQVRRVLRRRLRLGHVVHRMLLLATDERLVTEPEDHALRYALAANLGPLDFLLAAPETGGDWDSADAHEPLFDRLIDHAAQCGGGDLYYRALTPPELAPLGLHVVRVIVPGMQPVDFGYGGMRLGGRRLGELPLTLGLTRQRAELRDLNHHPHPFA